MIQTTKCLNLKEKRKKKNGKDEDKVKSRDKSIYTQFYNAIKFAD